jgi:hypothetical protein
MENMYPLNVDTKVKHTEEKNKPRKVFSGLVFPNAGFPFYWCIATELPIDKEKSLEEQKPIIQIVKEGQAITVSQLVVALKDFKKDKCFNIYIPVDKKFFSYVKDIQDWKRKEKVDLNLKPARSVSFEADILKLKDLIADKRLAFPDKSLIRSQLAIFSKASIEQEDNFFAVRSLCLIINNFQDEFKSPEEKPPDRKAWY